MTERVIKRAGETVAEARKRREAERAAFFREQVAKLPPPNPAAREAMRDVAREYAREKVRRESQA